MKLEEEVAALRAEHAGGGERIRQQPEQVTQALAQAQQRIAELERPKTPPPSFVKANGPVRLGGGAGCAGR